MPKQFQRLAYIFYLRCLTIVQSLDAAVSAVSSSAAADDDDDGNDDGYDEDYDDYDEDDNNNINNRSGLSTSNFLPCCSPKVHA